MISVCIIAKNAATLLPRCIESVAGLTDDIVVVVDEGTTDATEMVAKKYQANVITRKFINFADQKNYCISRAKHDWIISLDADEWLSAELAQELRRLDFHQAAYSVSRKNLIFGKFINHTNWDPNKIVRIFNKTNARFIGSIHERLEVNGKIGELHHSIIHHNYSSVEEFISRLNYYTTYESERIQEFSYINLFFQPLYDFGRRYIWHVGFLDLWHGLFLSYLQAIYHLSIWVKVWVKTNR